MYQADKSFLAEIDRWISEITEEYIGDLRTLTAVPSVSEESAAPYPYGKNCADVLDAMSGIAAGYGFSLQNHEYYCGSIVEPGCVEHPKRLGFFGHLDVVPVGEGWQYPPFGCTEADGFLVGRGVGDNKGPALCNLYALRFLREHGIRLRNDIMLYFGLSEETGMADIEYFTKTQQVPDYCFVTDTNFPVCYGEKGLLRVDLSRKLCGNLLSLSAGSVVNVIPSKAEAVLSCVGAADAEKALKGSGITAEDCQGGVRLTARGISKHAAFPEGAVNAIHVLMEGLSRSDLLSEEAQSLAEALSVLTADYYGESVGAPFEDQETGKLTCVGSVLQSSDGTAKLSFDVRYPVTADGNAVIDAFQRKASELGFVCTVKECSDGCYVPLDRPYVKLLCEICDAVQGKHYEPYTMGGGTYSRKLPQSIGFGPGLSDAPNPFPAGHGQGHQPDECVPLAVLLKGIKTYILAMCELDRIL